MAFSNIVALNFTISFYREILIGLRKIYLIELIGAVSSLIYLGIVLSFFYLEYFKWDIKFLIYAVPLNQTLAFILYIFIGLKLIKGLKINPFLFSLKELKDILKFSLHAYTQAIITIIQKNVNYVILGGILGTIYVGFYQIASKLQEVMKLLNDFYQSNVMPATTFLINSKKLNELKIFILNSNRFVFSLVFLAYFHSFF